VDAGTGVTTAGAWRTAERLPKGHRAGTHRLVAPEATLQRILPLLAAAGVTRLADVTGLDRLGIPVFCAIRPDGHILQTSNGKGLRPVDAKVSALMEAIEHVHAECPPAPLERASAASLRRLGRRVVAPERLPGFREDVFSDEEYLLEWCRAEELLGGGEAWVPASTVYISAVPQLHRFTANGLASGNHLVEATLHALYEVLERDAITRLSEGGRIRVRPPECRVVDPETIQDEAVARLAAEVDAAGVRVVLIHVAGPTSVPVFWAVLLDPEPLGLASMVNVGYGAHLNAAVAAVRAITEAAQSRLAYIHGAREDLAFKIRSQSGNELRALYRFFDEKQPELRWEEIASRDTEDLDRDLERVLEELGAAGFDEAYRVDLTRPPFEVPVVKVLVPGLRMDRRFF